MTTKAMLLDVDGTLVDSTYLHAVSWWQAFRQYGHVVPMATIHRAVGMGSDQLVPALLGEEATAQAEDLTAAHLALWAAWWPSLVPTPGASGLLRACAEAGLAVVLSTSASAPELEVMRRVIDSDESITGSTDGSARSNRRSRRPDDLRRWLG